MNPVAARLAVAIVPLVLAFSLCGCGGGGGGTTTTITTTTVIDHKDCLCVFDVDRTLTGKQGQIGQCPKDKEFDGVEDGAYSRGTLILSEFAVNLNKSACKACYIAVVSNGAATGAHSKERGVLFDHLSAGGKLPTTNDKAWSEKSQYPKDDTPFTGPLILGWPDELKQDAVPRILEWYAKNDVKVSDQEVYFFDDRENNVKPFAKHHPYNARQISCASRDTDKVIGMCGSALAEVVLEKGVWWCRKGDEDDVVV